MVDNNHLQGMNINIQQDNRAHQQPTMGNVEPQHQTTVQRIKVAMRPSALRGAFLGFEDKDKKIWDLITDVPYLASPFHIVAFVLNIVIPGSGTMLSSFFSHPCSKAFFIMGLMQLLLATVVIGWVWSIYWGWLIFARSHFGRGRSQDPTLMPAGQQRSDATVKTYPPASTVVHSSTIGVRTNYAASNNPPNYPAGNAYGTTAYP